MFIEQLEQWKIPGCLGYVRDYTTQLFGDHNKPLQGSRHETTSIMESKSVFFRGSFDFSWIFSLNCHLQHHRNQSYYRLINHPPRRHTNLRENRLWRFPWMDFLFFLTQKHSRTELRKIAIASWDSGLLGATALPAAMARGLGLALPPIIMVQWKMGVSPISVSFQLGWFSNETWLWEKGSVWRMATVIHEEVRA